MKINFIKKRIEQLKNIKTDNPIRITERLSELNNLKPTKQYGNIPHLLDGESALDLVVFDGDEIVVFQNWYRLAIYIEIKHYRKHPEEVQDKLMSILYQMYMEDKNGYSLQEIIDYMDDRYQEYFKNKIDIDQILQDFYDYKEEEWL